MYRFLWHAVYNIDYLILSNSGILWVPRLATLQLENERNNLLTNLNIGLTKTKKKQDVQNRKDINKLCTKKIQATEKLQHFNKYLAALNEEVRLSQIKDSGKHKNVEIYKLKTYKELKIHCNLNNLLFRVCNNKANGYKSSNQLNIINY